MPDDLDTTEAINAEDETEDDEGSTEKRERRARRSANALRLALRRRNAVELRITGATYDEIAQALGYSDRGQANRDVHRALKEITKEPAEQLRDLELARLDKLQKGSWVAAISGNDPKAAQVVIKVMGMRHKLLGLEAPRKVDLTGWLRDFSDREGLPYEDAVEAANEIIRLAASGGA